MFHDPDVLAYALATAALGIVTSDLAVGVLRGRFGTPQRQAVLELREMAGSEVPRRALRRAPAQTLGHSAAEHPPMRGTGVLWLEPERLGFLLRRPRRHLHVELDAVHRVSVSTVVRRPGFRPVRSREPMLVVEWWATNGLAMAAFRVRDAAAWARDIDEVRTPAEIVVPSSLTA